MRSHRFLFSPAALTLTLTLACSGGDADPLRCGAGTVDLGGVCVPAFDGGPRDGGPIARDDGSVPPRADGGRDGGVVPGIDGGPPPSFLADCDEPVSGPALHVRTDGDDARCDGSANAPGSAAPACAFRTIQAAVDSMSAGDTVLVHEGVYTDARSYDGGSDIGGRVTPHPSLTASVVVRGIPGATPSQRITIRGAPGEMAVLDGRGETNVALWVHEPAVTIRNLYIRDFAGDPTQDIFLSITNFFSSPDGEFVCNVVRDPEADAVEDGGGEVGFANSPRARIASNDIESGMPQLIAMGGSSSSIAESDSVIAGNVLVRVRSRALCPSCFRATRQLFIVGLKRQRRVRIDGNYIVDRGEPYGDFSTGLFLRDSEDYVVSNNVLEAISGEAGYLWHQDTWPGGANERAQILNNTFVGAAGDLAMKLQCSGCLVANNLLVGFSVGMDFNGSGADLSTGATTRVTHTLYDGVTTAIEPTGSSGYDVDASHDVTAGARLTASGAQPDPYFRPAAGSPAIDAGDTALCGHPADDGACDIGALEHE